MGLLEWTADPKKRKFKVSQKAREMVEDVAYVFPDFRGRGFSVNPIHCCLCSLLFHLDGGPGPQ
jgi:hypothetical protein